MPFTFSESAAKSAQAPYEVRRGVGGFDYRSGGAGAVHVI
jgi:hypothetical protein